MPNPNKVKRREVLFWSIAFPGFGQFLNGHIIKGITLILLEIVVNVMSSFNEGIRLSFLGETKMALEAINFQWLMFYPCLYLFAIWDAYRNAAADQLPPYYFLPFAFGAFAVTVGLMYSPVVYLFGIFPGPVFLPMLALVPGIFIGNAIRSILINIEKAD